MTFFHLVLQKFNKVDRDLETLSSIQGNSSQFKNKGERDSHLKKKIKELGKRNRPLFLMLLH
jgi:hypothetical protein